MKKLLVLSSFLLVFVGFASAQQASSKQSKLRDAAAQSVANIAKMDIQKRAMLQQSSNNAGTATELKAFNLKSEGTKPNF